MKSWYFTVVLTLAAIGLSVWAWKMANNRDFDVSFSASDDEAIAWADKAKEDRWVEIVERKRVDNKSVLVPIPNDEIDDYVRSHDSILVRRWLESDNGANILKGLVGHGYPDAAGLADETEKDASRQAIFTSWLTVAAIVLWLAAVTSAIRRYRGRKK
jgi:hypothetical protein